jgi:hypothetical protein
MNYLLIISIITYITIAFSKEGNLWIFVILLLRVLHYVEFDNTTLYLLYKMTSFIFLCNKNLLGRSTEISILYS